MAFSVKYSKKFQRVGVTKTYRVDILSETGGAVVVPDKMGADPLQIRTLSSEREEEKIVIGSECTFEFVLKKRANEAAYDELFESEYRDHIVKFYDDDTSTLLWQGYLQPESMYKSVFESNLHIYLSATDALKDLSDFEFLNSGNIVTGKLSPLAIIKQCLSNLDTDSQFQYNFVVKLGTKPDGMGANENALADTTLDCRRFFKTENGKTDVDNCLTVIEKVLAPFDCTLQQWGGQYRIRNIYERDSENYTYNWALAFQSKAAATDAVSVDSMKFSRDAELSLIPSVKQIGYKLLNRNMGEELVADLDDFSGAGPWDLSGFTPDDPDSEDGDTLLHCYITNNNVGSREVTLTSTFGLTKVTDNDYINLKFQRKSADMLGEFDKFPSMKITVVKPSGNSTTFEIPIIPQWELYESPRDEVFRVTEDGNYNIIMEFFESPSAAGAYSEDAYIKDVSLTKVVAVGDDTYSDITFDRYYRSTGDGKKIQEDRELYFGDSPGTNDLAAIVYSAANTSQWDRYGSTDEMPLLRIKALNYLCTRKEYSEYLVLNVKDSAAAITPINTITYNGVSYNIVSFEKSYRHSWVTLHLREVIFDALFDIDFLEIPLTTIDGKTTESTTTQLSGGGSVAWVDITGRPSWITNASTVGQALVDLTNPSAVTFIRINADNSISALSAANMRTAIDAMSYTLPVLGGDLDLNGKNISIMNGGSNGDYEGLVVLGDVDSNSYGFGSALGVDGDGDWRELDADSGSYFPCTGLALETGTGSNKKILLLGVIVNSGWSFDGGLPVYVSTTTGDLTTAPVAGSGDRLQRVGVALAETVLYFNPSFDVIEV